MADLPIRPLEDFFPLIEPYCRMVPAPMMEQALRLSAVEFCERTRCWRYLTTRTISREESTVVAPYYATIFEIESATFDGQRLTATQYTQLDQGLDPTADHTGQPAYITQKNMNSIVLIPAPSEPGTLVLSLFLKPKVMADLPVESAYSSSSDDDYNVIPEFMLVQHGEVIAAGALRRLLTIPNQPFTDPGAASQYLAQFERGCDNNFRSNLRGQHRAPSRVRSQYF